MKSSLVLLIYLLSLSFFYSCGETEDPEVAPTIASTEVYVPTNIIGDTWVPLSDTYVTELLNLQVPSSLNGVRIQNYYKNTSTPYFSKSTGTSRKFEPFSRMN